MRRRVFLTLFIPCFVWTLVLWKIHNLLYHSEQVTVSDRNSMIVSIDYFKNQYIKSIEIDENNKTGYNGMGVDIDPSEEKEKNERFDLFKFNELASSRIPLLRKIPDKRRKSCFSRKYTTNLPTASVVIVYRNEAWSTLLRTVHSCLSRAPYSLIADIVLVDDQSEYDKFKYLLKDLDEHFKDQKKVKIVRSPTRIGLTYARLLGAKEATGDVLIFLDSHCECNEGWLEPLLMDLKENPEYAITPIIEIISYEDFSIASNIIKTISVGSFTWKADFTWHTPRVQSQSYEIVSSPTMAGGLFAMRKDYFFKMGSYDERMTYWGGENIEISFRLWMCGKGIYTDPCSIISHVFRKNSPHSYPGKSVLFNKIRAVEVWMDDYKHIVYSKIGLKGYIAEAGSLASRFELRERLGCKTFDWYLKNVADFIRIPSRSTSIENIHTNLCLDVVDNEESGSPVRLFPCHNSGGNQAIEVDKKGLIVHDDLCLDLSSSEEDSKPTFYNCHFSGGNQQWTFIDKKIIKHETRELCLFVDHGLDHLIVKNCDPKDPRQHFKFELDD